MKVLLTGATGYIGSNLLRRLLKLGYEVSIIKLQGTNVPFNINDTSKFREYIYDHTIDSLEKVFKNKNYDVVIHLAAMVLSQHSKDDINILINSNILFGTQLLEMMRIYGFKNFINTGTYWQHYNNEEYNPVNLYAATKKAFEDILKCYYECYDFNIITLELFDNYGPNDPREKLFYWLKKSISSEKPVLLTKGEQLLSFVYIDDIIEAYLIAIDMVVNNKEKMFSNFSVRHNQLMKINEIVEIFQKINGKKINIILDGKKYKDREVMYAYDIIPNLPGWKPYISLEQGIRMILSMDYV